MARFWICSVGSIDIAHKLIESRTGKGWERWIKGWLCNWNGRETGKRRRTPVDKSPINSAAKVANNVFNAT
jgi:hypothetical protein